MSIVFYSYIDRLDKKRKCEQFFTKSGTKFEPTYEYQIIDGIKMLVKNGERDIYSEIQSYGPSADINNVINRFLNGESDLLSVKNGIYADVTDFPTNYAEMFSRVQQCENVFNSLPIEVRKEFDNSYYKFWNEFGSEKFNNVFEKYNNSISQNENGIDTPSVSAVSDEMKGVTENA